MVSNNWWASTPTLHGWVPLEKIQWFFSGQDHNGSFTVKISPPGYGSDTTTFPEWSQVVNRLKT